MAKQFSNQLKASANIYRPETTDKFKIAGINGRQTSADNFYTAMTGILGVVGLTTQKMERGITQEVEDAP